MVYIEELQARDKQYLGIMPSLFQSQAFSSFSIVILIFYFSTYYKYKTT